MIGVKKLMSSIRLIERKFHDIFTYERTKYNITSVKPYWIVNDLSKHSIVVNVGTGPEADFSQNLIRRYGLKAHGFDPTIKHHPNLENIVKKMNGFFK